MYTGGLFHCYMLDESICILGVSVHFLILILFLMENHVLSINVDPDQMPHYLASDLGLHCLPMTLLRVSR